MQVSSLFTSFELIASTLLRSDLEEIGRMLTPDLPTRVAVFAYGIMMGLLNKEDFPTRNRVSPVATTPAIAANTAVAKNDPYARAKPTPAPAAGGENAVDPSSGHPHSATNSDWFGMSRAQQW